MVGAATTTEGDEIVQLLNEYVEQLGARPRKPALSPVSAMTAWLAADEAPIGFTIDQDTERRATTQSKSTVRYVRHTPETDDVRRHIEAGKQCTRLALTRIERVSFLLTETLTIKRVAPFNVLHERDSGDGGEGDRFDGNFALMVGELKRLKTSVDDALGP